MTEHNSEKNSKKGDLRSFIESCVAWGSISYVFGFVTVVLHTTRLGLPVLELLSSLYIWIGFPLTLVVFLWTWGASFFQARAIELISEIKASWKGLHDEVDIDTDTLIIDLFNIVSIFSPLLAGLIIFFTQKILEKGVPLITKRLIVILNRFRNFLRGIEAILGFSRLFFIALITVVSIHFYVWELYPKIPQSLGGGAPITVKLLVNVNSVPPNIPGLFGSSAVVSGQESAITEAVELFYITENQYYFRTANDRRLSLRKDSVEGVIWNP